MERTLGTDWVRRLLSTMVFAAGRKLAENEREENSKKKVHLVLDNIMHSHLTHNVDTQISNRFYGNAYKCSVRSKKRVLLKLIMSSLMDSVSTESLSVPDKTELTVNARTHFRRTAFYRTLSSCYGI